MKEQKFRDQSGAIRHEAAEAVAIAALSYLAAEPERLGRFVAITGVGPERIRETAREPGFLAAVLDYFANDEELLVAFAREVGGDPADVERARASLGASSERDLP